jgi:hypothetical protein
LSYRNDTPSLTFQTKFGDTPNQGRVAIYSPSCNEWGEQVLTSNNPTSILAWGLSINHPVLFVPAFYPGLGYASPKFEYGGKIYGPADCSCHVNPANGSHDCVCRFDCVPFQLDSKAEVDADADADAAAEVAMTM